MQRGTWVFGGALLALLAVFALKGVLVALPAIPESAVPGEFDTARAFARLERILGDQQPHPVDSLASDGVRERLLAELRAAGLQPRVADTQTCSTFTRGRSVICSRVRNIVATVGPAEGAHLLLVSHYDSNVTGPGAADDGIGVASMIEVAALLRDQPLRRPITFLWNEGEETGLSGARAYLDSDPTAARVDTLINLEARGTQGPAIMFETSRPNGAALAAFARGSRRPVANSLSTDFYRLIPNSTDVTIFEERPWTILNFAIIGNETRYHSAGDDLAALDRRSLHHMGSQALDIARGLALGEVPAASSGELVYADVAGRVLVTLPLVVALVVLGLLILLFAAIGWRRKALGRPLLAVVAAVVGAGLLAFAANWGVGLARAGDYWRAYPLVTYLAVYAGVLLACSAALLLLARGVSRERLRPAAWLVVLLVGALACAVAPGAAIYFLFPPLLLALGAAIARWWPTAERIAAIAAGLLLLFTFAEVIGLVEVLLVDGPVWAVAPLAALAMLPLLIEARPAAPLPSRAVLLPLAALVLAGWAAALLVPRASAERQQQFTIEYVRDETARTTRWAVSNKRAALPDAFAELGQWELGELPYSTRRRWVAPAPHTPVPAPTLEALTQQPMPGGRRVAFTLRPNGADSVAVRFAPETPVLAAGTAQSMRDPGSNAALPTLLRCFGRSCEGMRMEVVLRGTASVEAQLIGTRPGLPPAARPLIEARPANARAQYTPDSTITIGRARF